MRHFGQIFRTINRTCYIVQQLGILSTKQQQQCSGGFELQKSPKSVVHDKHTEQHVDRTSPKC